MPSRACDLTILQDTGGCLAIGGLGLPLLQSMTATDQLVLQSMTSSIQIATLTMLRTMLVFFVHGAQATFGMGAGPGHCGDSDG